MPTDRTVLTRLKLDVKDFVKGTREAGLAVKALTSEIDTSSDRTAYLAQGFLALGPTIAPLGAAAIPVFSGLATQLTIAGAAAATAGLAFNGVGDALKALNDYQIDPTDAHLKKLNQTMAKIGPAGQEFVHFLDEVGPKFATLANVARGGLFPGVEGGITHLLDLLPQVKRIVKETASTLGDLADAGGAGLAGPRFAEFFAFLENDAQPILVEMGHTLGNFVDGIAALIVAFEPLSADFSKGFEDMSKSFADWAHSLDGSKSFADFVSYIRESGPQVRDLLGAISDAIVGLLQAAAPVGNILLPAFTDLFKVIDLIASSPIGPVFVGAAAAIGLYGRAVAIAEVSTGGFFGKVVKSEFGIKAQGKAALTAAGELQVYEASMARVNRVLHGNTLVPATGIANFAKAAAPAAISAGLLAASLTGVADETHLSNTASLGFAGSLAGPFGTALGASIGLLLDAKASTEAFGKSVNQVVESGDIEAMADKLEQSRKRLTDLDTSSGVGDFFDDFNKNVVSKTFTPWRSTSDETQKDIGKLKRAIADTTAEQQAAQATETLGIALAKTTEKARHQAEAFKIMRSAALTSASAFIDISHNADNAHVSLTDFIRGLENQAKALTEFGENAKTAAEHGLHQGLIKQLQALGPAGALRLEQLANATDTQIARANKAFENGRRAIQTYQETITGIPQTYVTRFNLTGDGPAIESLRKIATLLASIKDKKVVLDFFVNQTNALNKRDSGSAGPNRGADGATVPKTGLPYADRHLYLLADGEEIITNRHGEADRFRADRDSGRIPGYANGGTAGQAPSTAYGSHSYIAKIDLDELHEIAAMMRPTVGTQVIQPHNYNEFLRQDRQNQRNASAGGLRRGSPR